MSTMAVAMRIMTQRTAKTRRSLTGASPMPHRSSCSSHPPGQSTVPSHHKSALKNISSSNLYTNVIKCINSNVNCKVRVKKLFSILRIISLYSTCIHPRPGQWNWHACRLWLPPGCSTAAPKAAPTASLLS